MTAQSFKSGANTFFLFKIFFPQEGKFFHAGGRLSSLYSARVSADEKTEGLSCAITHSEKAR